MLVDDFDFALPEELIAQSPAVPRESARLLHVAERLQDLRVADLPALLGPGDLLVLNDTAVLPTRFFARRGEAEVEVTLIAPEGSDRWWALARPGKRLRPGDEVRLADGLLATVLAKELDGRILLGFRLAGMALLEAIKANGAMPLPPYIRRARGGDPRDRDDYQTVFARHDGSVAAPTASLHLTRELLASLEARGVKHCFITLHVGMGTFLPVKATDTDQHVMHAEWLQIGADTASAIERHRAAGGRVAAVGTSALRAVESMADMDGRVRAGSVDTRLFVTPGYRFRAVDRLVTNFHLPKSTLFMLVSAFAGMRRMRAAYDHAIEGRYRFFSYGDASLIERNDESPD